ncbi:hypothetical protein FB465_3701 [Kitasatospora atroaurantiaca]|uniref:Regulatory protein n=1 Tax=Kitasatospora atroaurantiaca TaxID=285545 RepID=A0A561ESN3_9ACTN|nr:hypothetical protein [Kitasatospora atroaurantiaca]TWE18620.1 hypothetical protein FB465_3701 [Kitasatospora atroaurantiaca]
MRFIPVDTTGALVMVAQEPRLKLKNRQTGEMATDAETGVPLMTLDVTFVANGQADILSLTVPQPGIPEGLVPGTLVALTKLIARPWENEFNGQKRSGIAFRADAVTATVPALAGAKG